MFQNIKTRRRHPLTRPAFRPEEFLKSMNLIIDLDQLLENFSAKVRELFDVSTVYVVLLEPITNRYVGKHAKGYVAELLHEFNFSRADNLIKWLNVNKCTLDVMKNTEVVKFLSIGEQELLRKSNIRLVIPLVVINRLTGAIFFAEKLSGVQYTEADIELISALTNRSALAIEYAMIHQFQEEKLKRLFHADKLATVGELAAGAAHEIRNPLTSIRSTVQYIEKDLPEKKQHLVKGVLEEIDRIDRIIRGLLSFSKTSELHVEIVEINQILDQTLFLLEPELRKHNIAVEKTYDCGTLSLAADGSQLKQVFLNILLNSIQAMSDESLAGQSKKVITVVTSAEANNWISVRIADTGAGISRSVLSRVFDPFFTTKETGIGLGLSISYGIVSKHGGEIEIASTTDGQGRGTCVTVKLPMSVDGEESGM
jgi:signal transduction histidine kinase